MGNEQKIEKLIKAGAEYQGALDVLRSHQRTYTRMVMEIGVREQSALQSSKRAIKLPTLPAIEDQEKRVAEHLIAYAIDLSHRPGRLSPSIQQSEIASIVPIRSKAVEFSPSALARELSNKLLGSESVTRLRQQAVDNLVRMERDINTSKSWCIDGISSSEGVKGRLIDTNSSHQLRVWLVSYCEVLEFNGLTRLLAHVEEFVQEIDAIGQATIQAIHALHDASHSIVLALRHDHLLIHVSGSLLMLLESFSNDSATVNQDRVAPVWFRNTWAQRKQPDGYTPSS